MTRIYNLSALRALALYAQQLHTPNLPVEPDADAIFNTVNRLGCVQLDTLQMVHRSHNLVIWSRLGSYDPDTFYSLIYGSTPLLFEGWQHAASIIPLSEYRYQIPRHRTLKVNPSDWYSRWLSENHNSELLVQVLERIRVEGGLRASDFAYDGPKRGSWWDWKPAKMALEHHFSCGDLMVSGRPNFQRVYDLTSRVLPEWVDRTIPTIEQRDRFWIERSVRSLGVCTPVQAADYTWMKLGHARPAINELVRNGILLQIEAEIMDGETETLLIHRDQLPNLDRAAEGEIRPSRTTFLSPFDSLFWARHRDQKLWGFRQSLEAYLPPAKRMYGYYCLPILHKDRLIGRFDPKLFRKENRLVIKALYLEPGIHPDEELIIAVTTSMRDFMRFHLAKELVIESSYPAEFGKKLLAAI